MISETDVMQIIVYAGNAKSLAMNAIKEARKGAIDTAKKMLDESKDNLKIAHQQHTDILQNFANNPDEPATMFLTHAQDHMMAAITATDFTKELIDLHEEMQELRNLIKKSA
ncbi:PTS lactose/cellobiose transporter subunit IIA [Enterococcus wangshanyuanii]|uniref:Lichenan-specific phosphotransferase enzyme IIA component n=1 Tax=Enterococcus wangshanyuanii TaxID=2005703 RepID=A0ABQ1PVN4_9ENTE|nr:PTS lactose/cellobiose transporter subunit IIA [Enterococcus wangshanyuanii]GGD05273.1 lichenan-specific phosphotransferase enzyme IIA component [Enterococcus wangshanyuanii]